MKRPRLFALVVLLAGGAVLAFALGRGRHPPFFPQFRRQVRDKLYSAVAFATRFDPEGQGLMVAPPSMPKQDVVPSVAAYKSAIAAGKDHPGAAAFRADTDLYCEYNRKALEEQARKEGLTVDQVKELTFFGFAAMRTTQPEKVAQVIGHELTPEQTRKLDAILKDENDTFRAAMHQQVDEGASDDQKWETIRAFEQHYIEQFEREFGMTEAQFDQMLAPDPQHAGPAMAVPLPPNVPLPPPEPARTEPVPPPDPNVPPKPVVAPLKPVAAPSSGTTAPPPPPPPAPKAP